MTWRARIVDEDAWQQEADRLAAGQATMMGLWGETDRVHMAVLDEAVEDSAIEVLTLPCPDGRFPSVAEVHLPALRLERTIRDLHGLEPQGLTDRRAWLDHGTFGGDRPAPYAFLPVDGEALHQIPVGPVHAGIIEPGHFRFTCDGETVVRLEQRLGYVHKGTESLLAGADIPRGAKLAGRVSGDSTVAYAIAYARAVEDALGIAAPPRAAALRAVMAEMERIANHLGDVGAICNDASFTIILAHCAMLREGVLRTAMTCFGHRLMMDRAVPGGVATDLTADGARAIRDLIATIERKFPPLVALYDNTASLLDRTVTTGIVSADLVRRFGTGGHVGRASGRGFDCRRRLPYAPYDSLRFEVPVLQEGDVNARLWIRVKEITESLSIIGQLLDALPEGPLTTALPAPTEAREGLALAESFRGDVLVWLRLGVDGRIERCHLRDPSWFQWPLLEAAIEGNIVADFPLCNKSFNCSYSGHDL